MEIKSSPNSSLPDNQTITIVPETELDSNKIEEIDVSVKAVTKRNKSRMEKLAKTPVVVPALKSLNIAADEFLRLQLSCPTLNFMRKAEMDKTVITTRDGSKFQIIQKNNYYLRKCVFANKKTLIDTETLLVPESCRERVLATAHESLFAGHFSHRKTEMLVKTQFFWPCMSAQIRRFVRSCPVCQTHTMVRPAPAPLGRIPIITEPFSHISMDLIGPLNPCTSEGHRYVLTIIDVASGYPEAVPMKNIDSISVAEALVTFFLNLGFQ